MLFWELFLIAISLCFDSLAIAITCGLTTQVNRKRKATLIACTFATVQATIPLVGYLSGLLLEQIITGVDHWIALGLLSFIGGKMIYESVRKDKKENSDDNNNCKELTFMTIFVMGIATSIDALMMGVTFAFLSVNMVITWITFWIVTFIIVFGGFFIGNRVGHYFKSGTEILGGIILISLGFKILIEDLFL
jgi:manganese efflux pump family protein